MRIAVTGAGGVLGRAVTELAVEQGHSVVAIDRDRVAVPAASDSVTVHQADLTRYDGLAALMADCDAMVHLAALLSPRAAPEPVVHNNNVVSGYNAMAAANEAGLARICVASSVNAIGGAYSVKPRYDYFPLDVEHPSYAEDPYSLSKWLGEQQTVSFHRRRPGLTTACLRLHALRERASMADQFGGGQGERGRKDLWGYTPVALAARACLATLTADIDGHETFYVVAEDTYLDIDSAELRDRFYPDVPLRDGADLSGRRSFFDSDSAAALVR